MPDFYRILTLITIKIMKTLGSLSELADLLGNAQSAAPVVKTGYDGKPQRIRVSADSKRRAGKTVTLASGFQSTPDELDRIVALLKKRCGAGGRVLNNEIEIQGNHTGAVKKILRDEGYAIK